MTTEEIDPVGVKKMQRANWNALSSGWDRAQDEFEQCGAASVTTRLLDLGKVRTGHVVLDVGTGTGEPAISASERVGPKGKVLGVDLAPDMLDIARRRAGTASNIEFAEADVESLELPPASFDTVLSRWGLMFAVDHVTAFRTLANVLVPGGVLAAVVWGPAASAPIMSLGFQALSARLEMQPPPPGTPGPFSMSDPELVRTDLAEAGFTSIEVTELEVPFRLASVRRYVEFNQAVTPPDLCDLVRTRFGSDKDPATWAAVEQAAEPYRTADGGVYLPSTALLVRAVVPSC